jgi:hypothetical protein
MPVEVKDNLIDLLFHAFYPRLYVRTTRVYVLLCFCSSWGDISQNTALLSNFTMLSAYCTIACSLARPPCPAALPDCLARQPCLAALPGSLARQPCPAALPGSPARSLARQSCRNITSLITGRGRRPAPDQTFKMLLIGFDVKIRSKNLIRV